MNFREETHYTFHNISRSLGETGVERKIKEKLNKNTGVYSWT